MDSGCRSSTNASSAKKVQQIVAYGYASVERWWIKDVVNDNEIIHEELCLLNDLAIPLKRVADMFAAQLNKGTERIKSGETR